MAFNPNDPSWLLDPTSTGDPLLDDLERQRRQRQAALDLAQEQQAQTAGPVVTGLQPLDSSPVVPTGSPPVADTGQSDLEAAQRNLEAAQRADAARRADQEAAGVKPDGQPHPSRQDTDGGLVQPTSRKEGVGAWDAQVTAASQAYGVPKNVIQAIMDIESGGDPTATSHAGAMGLMQVMGFHAQNGEDLYDPMTNIQVGTRILAENYQRYGTWEQAVAAYFGAIDANGNITSASDGNTDGYGYVNAFRAKAQAYAEAVPEQTPSYGPQQVYGPRSDELGDAIGYGNTRPSQLPESNPDLSIAEAYAACGPAAAIVFAAMTGRAPSLKEAVEMGKSIKAWDAGVGMYGPEAEVQLIRALGGAAHLQPGFDPQTVIREVQAGNPVIVDSPGHYGVISGYDPSSQRFYFGSSATDLKGGQSWMTLDEYEALKATGAIRAMILVDNPIGQGPSAAAQSVGPSSPQTYRPQQSGQSQQERDLRASQETLDAANELAKRVNEQVQKDQQRARDEQAKQLSAQAQAMVSATPQTYAFGTESAPPPVSTTESLRLAQTASQTPVQSEPQPSVQPDTSTEGFVSRARAIDQQFAYGPGTQYTSKEQRDADPAFQLAATTLTRDWQATQNPQPSFDANAFTASNPGARLAMNAFTASNPGARLAMEAGYTLSGANRQQIEDTALKHRQEVLQRQVDARTEEPKNGPQIWEMTPDEYVAWRRSQGLEIRQDEYQRHASAVLDAATHGARIPDSVKDAYGADRDLWAKNPEAAMAPIGAVANGTPYDGDAAEHRYQGLTHLPAQIGAIAVQAADTWDATWLSMLKSSLTASGSVVDFASRRAGVDLGNPLQAGADNLGAFTNAHPELSAPIHAEESASEQVVKSLRPDRFVTNIATLAPYMIALSAAGAVAAPIAGALGLTGAAATAFGLIAPSLAVTGITSYGDFYDQAVHADPKSGQQPLGKDQAMLWAGVHALAQSGIEIALGKAIGSTLGKAAEAAVSRSPMLKQATEMLARSWVPHVVKEGLSESLEEGAQQLAENFVARQSYDPSRDLMKDVVESMVATLGPSGLMAARVSPAQNRLGFRVSTEGSNAAQLRGATGMDEHRVEQMQHEVKTVADAERFVEQQRQLTTAYGRSVGWDQRQIDLGQARAAQVIYAQGIRREMFDRKLSPEAYADDPAIQRGRAGLAIAQGIERATANAKAYATNQRSAEQGQQLDRTLAERGLTGGTESSITPRSRMERAVPERYALFQNGTGPYRSGTTLPNITPEITNTNINPLPPAGVGEPSFAPAEGTGVPVEQGVAQRSGEGNQTPPPTPSPPGYQGGGFVGAPVERKPRDLLREASERKIVPAPLSVRSESEVRAALENGQPVSPAEHEAYLTPERLGAVTDRTIPKTTARVGPFEAPGEELGQYERLAPNLGVWQDVAEWHEYPIAVDPSVQMAGRAPDPEKNPGLLDRIRPVIMKVAQRQYLGGFIQSSKAILDTGVEGAHPATALLQSVADVVLGGKQPADPSMIRLGHIIAATSEQYGWSGHKDPIALNPAEIYHFAVVNVAKEEQERGQPYTPAEQRQRIIETMAEKQVEVLLHEAAHSWGTLGGSREDQHGGDFATLFKPIGLIISSVNEGVLSNTQAARIAQTTGLTTEQVRALGSEIDAMVKATISTLSATFATVEGQADNLALLNQDAREQRLLALSPEDAQRATSTTDRSDLRPLDTDVGRGPQAPPVDDTGAARAPGSGESAEGVRGGEGAPSEQPVASGATELRPPESAPTEPGVRPASELTDGIDAVATDKNGRPLHTKTLKAATRRLDELTAQGYDVGDARDALQEYADLSREDYEPGRDGAEEYQSAKADAYEAFLQELQGVERTSSTPQETTPPAATTSPVEAEVTAPETTPVTPAAEQPAEQQPESTPGIQSEPGPVGQLTDPRLPAAPLADLRQAINAEVRAENKARNEGRDEAKISAVMAKRATKLAATLRQRSGDPAWDAADPATVLRQSGAIGDPAAMPVAMRLIQALYPGREINDQRNALTEYGADRVMAHIQDEPDPYTPETDNDGMVWDLSQIGRVAGISDQQDQREIRDILLKNGYIDQRDREVPPEARAQMRRANRAAEEESDRQARELAESQRREEQVAKAREERDRKEREAKLKQLREERQRETEPATNQTTTTEAPKIESHRDREQVLADIADDTSWVYRLTLGNGALGVGKRLATAMIADGDKVLTRQNRQLVLDAITRKIAQLSDAISSARQNGGVATTEQRQRSILLELERGFGRSADEYEFDPAVTEAKPDASGTVVNEPIVRYYTPADRSKLPQVLVRGIGTMISGHKDQEVREAWRIIGQAVADIELTPFVDNEGNAIGMGTWVRNAFELMYGDPNVSNEQILADTEELAQELLKNNPDLDVTLPQAQTMMLQAFQIQAQRALANVREAAARDMLGTRQSTRVIRDEQGREIGRGGTEKAEALRALQELMATSSLLKGVKKVGTASGRVLRAMQMAEERMTARGNLLTLQSMDTHVTGMVKTLKRIQREIEQARKDGGRANPLLNLLRTGRGGTGASADFSEIIRQGGTVDQYLTELLGNIESASDIAKFFTGPAGENTAFLTSKEYQQLQAALQKEQDTGEPMPDTERKALVHRIVTQGFVQFGRRERDRLLIDGKSVQARAKDEFRKRGENWARELINSRINTLESWQVEQLGKQIEQGILPDLQKVMADNPDKQTLYADLHRKLQEIRSWQAQNDPQTRVWKQAHPNGLAGAAANQVTVRGLESNPQWQLGDAYLRESALDDEITYLESWLGDARNGIGILSPDEIETYLTDRRQERARLQLEIDSLETDALTDRVIEMRDKVIERSAKRLVKQDTMTDEELEADLRLMLGAQLTSDVDRKAVRELLAGHEIGKLDQLLREKMREHFHQTFDARTEAEYWVSFLERMERQYGASEDPDEQQHLASLRDRVSTALYELMLHPQFGERMAQALQRRIDNATHGNGAMLLHTIQRALTDPNHRVGGTRHAEMDDITAVGDHGVLAALTGDQANPGPLTRAVKDRHDQQAQAALVDALNAIEQKASHGLGTEFKQAVLAAVDIQHRRDAILEMLPMVEANPADRMVRYIVESQLFELKEQLADRETERWFRQRFGSTEVSLRAKYDAAVEKGAQRLVRDAEKQAAAEEQYAALRNLGIDTPADATRAIEGRPHSKSVSELAVERMERQQVNGIAVEIRDTAEALWSEPDYGRRQILQDRLADKLSELARVGFYTDPQTGERKGVGLEMATRINDKLAARQLTEWDKLGVRQQGWTQRAEIEALTTEIRELHQRLLEGHPGDDDGSIQAALQAELQDRLQDLAAVGATEPEDSLKDMGVKAADKLVKQLDLKAVRYYERAQDRVARRKAVEEVRTLREEAMALVQRLVKNPSDPAARARLDEKLLQMESVGYEAHEDREVVDHDPVNGGIIGKRTERVLTRVEYGRQQADRIRAMTDVRIGSSLTDIESQANRTNLERDEEKNLIKAVQDRLRMLSQAARSSDDLSRIHAEIGRLLGSLEKLGVAGKLAHTQETQRLHSVGFTRAMLQSDEQARMQMANFFAMISSGKAEDVGRALRLVSAPNWATFYKEYGLVAMLSSPATWGLTGVNMVGQLLNVAISPARWGTKWAADIANHLVFGTERSVFLSEVGAGARALADLGLWKNAGKGAWQIWLHGHSDEQVSRANITGDLRDLRPEYLVDWTRDRGGAWKIVHGLSILGHMGSLRIMKAADEFIGSLAYAAAFEGQMERKAQQTGQSRLAVYNDVSALSDVVAKTGKVRSGLLFQERGKWLGRVNFLTRLDHSSRTGHKANPAEQILDMIASTFVPFTTVPYNALKQSMELSGLGTLYHGVNYGVRLRQGYGKTRQAGERMAKASGETTAAMRIFDVGDTAARQAAVSEAEEMADYLGKAILGAMVQGLAVYLALNGSITGDEPDDPDARAIDEEEKLPPRSVYLPFFGGRWYSYDSTPFSVPFAIAANFAQGQKKEWARQEKAGGATTLGVVGNALFDGTKAAVFHNFFLENAIDTISALTGKDEKTKTPESRAYSLLSPFVTRHIPAIMAYYARNGDGFIRNYDPWERDTRAEQGDWTGRLGNLAMSRVPGLREQLPAKVGIQGERIENKNPFGAGLVAYSKSQQAQFDSLFRVLEKYDAATNLQASDVISEPGRKNGQFEIDLAEQRRWQETFGTYLRKEVAYTYNNPDFNQMPINVQPGQSADDAFKDMQTLKLRQAVQRARAKADEGVLSLFGPPNSRQRSEIVNQRIAAYRKKKNITPADFD